MLDVIGQTRIIRVRAEGQPGVPPPGEMRQPLFRVAITMVEVPDDEGRMPAVETAVAGEGLDLPRALTPRSCPISQWSASIWKTRPISPRWRNLS